MHDIRGTLPKPESEPYIHWRVAPRGSGVTFFMLREGYKFIMNQPRKPPLKNVLFIMKNVQDRERAMGDMWTKIIPNNYNREIKGHILNTEYGVFFFKTLGDIAMRGIPSSVYDRVFVDHACYEVTTWGIVKLLDYIFQITGQEEL